MGEWFPIIDRVAEGIGLKESSGRSDWSLVRVDNILGIGDDRHYSRNDNRLPVGRIAIYHHNNPPPLLKSRRPGGLPRKPF